MNDYSKLNKTQIGYIKSIPFSRMKAIVNGMLIKVGGIENYQLDDFYSLANFELMKAASTYDYSKNDNFEKFFCSNLNRKICTMIRDMNRKKRAYSYVKETENGKETVFVKDVRLDAPLMDSDKKMIDTVVSCDSFEDEIFLDYMESKQTKKFLENCTKKDLLVIKAKIMGYVTKKDISKVTKLSVSEVENSLEWLKYNRQYLLGGKTNGS